MPAEVLEQLQQNKKLYRIILQNYPSLLHCRSTSEKGLNKMAEETISRIPVTFSLKVKKSDKKVVTHQVRFNILLSIFRNFSLFVVFPPGGESSDVQ